MKNSLRPTAASVLGPPWWLAPLMDYLHPRQFHTFRSLTCGDRFEWITESAPNDSAAGKVNWIGG